MSRSRETHRYEIADGDVVELSLGERDLASDVIGDVIDFLNGEADWFAEFEVPSYEGEQGLVQVDEDTWENRGFDGGVAEFRLIAFAHLVRPFNWPDDPRFDAMRELVTRLDNPRDDGDLQSVSTQDLWDALFIHARGERFVEGTIAASAVGLTRVANEIRRRLLDSRSSGGTG